MLPQLSSLYAAIQDKYVTHTEFLTTVEGIQSRDTEPDQFQAFIERVSQIDDTWKLWACFSGLLGFCRLIFGNKMPEIEAQSV